MRALLGGRATADTGQEQGEAPVCDTCGKPLTFIAVYNAWYCYPCQKYGLVLQPQPGSAQYAQLEQQAASAATGTYPQSVAQTSYDSYSTEAAKATRASNKCVECGGPLTSSGECNHCRAKELLALAEKRSSEAQGAGVDVRKAEQLLRDARNKIDEGNFGEARTSAEKAGERVTELLEQFRKSKDQIREAEGVVADLKGQGHDMGQAESLIQLAQSFLKTGNYDKAIAYGKKAVKTANEAVTRQQAEKALEGRPPLPPAVARPVDVPAARGPPPTIVSGEKAPQPAAPSKCPRCGESVEAGWKKCPSCAADMPEAEAAPPSSPAAKPPAESRDAEYAAVEKEIRLVESELGALEKKGENVTHARNLLKLASSFLKGGSYEKASRYARKVKNVLDERGR